MQRRGGSATGHRRASRLPRKGDDVRHRRFRQDVEGDLQRALADRRPAGGGAAARPAAGGHGVLPVPSHRHLQAGHSADRSRARRRRGVHQRQGRALHGALHAHDEGPGAARHLLALIYLEIREGRGINGKDYVYLDVRPDPINKYFEADGNPKRIDAHYLETRLPDIIEFSRVYLGIDPIKEPMPIQPTAHYAMGGIPTNNDTRSAFR